MQPAPQSAPGATPLPNAPPHLAVAQLTCRARDTDTAPLVQLQLPAHFAPAASAETASPTTATSAAAAAAAAVSEASIFLNAHAIPVAFDASSSASANAPMQTAKRIQLVAQPVIPPDETPVSPAAVVPPVVPLIVPQVVPLVVPLILPPPIPLIIPLVVPPVVQLSVPPVIPVVLLIETPTLLPNAMGNAEDQAGRQLTVREAAVQTLPTVEVSV